MQLSEATNKFDELGIKILAVTYDSNSDSKKFADRRDIQYPVALDENSQLIKTLGILNKGPQPGDSAYGIPYPGMFLVDHNGIIRAKFAEASFRDRPDLAKVLLAAATLK